MNRMLNAKAPPVRLSDEKIAETLHRLGIVGYSQRPTTGQLLRFDRYFFIRSRRMKNFAWLAAETRRVQAQEQRRISFKIITLACNLCSISIAEPDLARASDPIRIE